MLISYTNILFVFCFVFDRFNSECCEPAIVCVLCCIPSNPPGIPFFPNLLNFVAIAKGTLQVISQWIMDQPHLGHKLPRPGYSRLRLYLPCHLNGPSNRYGISPLFCSFLSILLTLRLSWCPACFGNLLTSRHVLQDCVAVEEVRVREGIRTFLNDCKIAGRSSATAYRLYVTGEDAFGSKIATEEHLQRGGCLSRLTDEWLDLWESVTG